MVPPGSAGVPPSIADIDGQSEVGTGACGTRPSIASAADGYTYDSTTTPRFVAKETLGLNPGKYGDDTPPGYITYPFPRLKPNPEYFRCVARQENPKKCNVANSAGYWVGQPTNANWGLSASSANKVAFVDAQGKTVHFNPDSSVKNGTTNDNNNNGGTSLKGIIVVWCGNLQQDGNFRGIILNLVGDDLDGNTQCGNEAAPSTSNVGVYSNNGRSCTCWVYAGGGTSTRAGIILRQNSEADFLPGGSWDNLPTTAFDGPPPTEFVIRSWRELYS